MSIRLVAFSVQEKQVIIFRSTNNH